MKWLKAIGKGLKVAGKGAKVAYKTPVGQVLVSLYLPARVASAAAMAVELVENQGTGKERFVAALQMIEDDLEKSGKYAEAAVINAAIESLLQVYRGNGVVIDRDG